MKRVSAVIITYIHITVNVYVTIPVAARCKALRPLNCWDRGFEFHRGHGCLSLVSVVCQVEDSASCWSLIQRSPTECGVYKNECHRRTSYGKVMTRIRAEGPQEKKNVYVFSYLTNSQNIVVFCFTVFPLRKVVLVFMWLPLIEIHRTQNALHFVSTMKMPADIRC